MTPADLEFVERLVNTGVIGSPCLEVGAGLGGANCRDVLEKAKIECFGTDLVKVAGVDFVVDLESAGQSQIRTVFGVRAFKTILLFNVLEHIFEPLKVLDNLLTMLAPGGVLAIITPSVWPLHYHPLDCWRINPQFYEEYCRRRGLLLLPEHFEWVGIQRVTQTLDASGRHHLPGPGASRMATLWGRVVHRLFSTYARGMLFPSHVAIGVVIKKPAPEAIHTSGTPSRLGALD